MPADMELEVEPNHFSCDGIDQWEQEEEEAQGLEV